MPKKILIVDDSPSMRQMVKFTLTEDGYETVEAEDGKVGLTRTDGCSLIITDYNMPEMNGIAFIKGVRAQAATKFTPIIMLTTEHEDVKKDEGKAAGATAWLVKPFTPEVLKETVKKLIG
ncbi:MAG: response regulator [Spirochaetes bacterium]|nr:response regulator [Spirochaetota bacterium]